jgi:hypothetical protein
MNNFKFGDYVDHIYLSRNERYNRYS